MKKIRARQLILKKIFMLWPKKNSCKEFDNEKKFLRLENPPSPHNFSNGPSLILSFQLLTFSLLKCNLYGLFFKNIATDEILNPIYEDWITT